MNRLDLVLAGTLILCGIGTVFLIAIGRIIGSAAVFDYIGSSIVLLGGAYIVMSERNDYFTTSVVAGYCISAFEFIKYLPSVLEYRFNIGLILCILSIFLFFFTFMLNKGLKHNTYRIKIFVLVFLALVVIASLWLRVNNIPWKLIFGQDPSIILELIMMGAWVVILSTPYLNISGNMVRIVRDANALSESAVTDKDAELDEEFIPLFECKNMEGWEDSDNPVTEKMIRIPLYNTKTQEFLLTKLKNEDTLRLSVISIHGEQRVSRMSIHVRNVRRYDGYLYVFGDDGVFVRIRTTSEKPIEKTTKVDLIKSKLERRSE